MHLPPFLKPNGAKIIYFLFLLVVAPFPYLIFSETLSQYEVNWIWGFPPLISWIYDYLPASLQELNIGLLEISNVKIIYLFIPSYAFVIFLLSCVIGLIVDKIKVRYGITSFRGLLWKKLQRKGPKPSKKAEKPEKIEKAKEEPKEEEKVEEKKEEKLEEIEGRIDEEKIKKVAELIREEETFLRERRKELQKFLDEMNVKKLKNMGIDMKQNKILCSDCKKWKTLPKGKLTKLIEEHGLDVIWEYRCPDCKGRK